MLPDLVLVGVVWALFDRVTNISACSHRGWAEQRRVRRRSLPRPSEKPPPDHRRGLLAHRQTVYRYRVFRIELWGASCLAFR